MRRLLRDGRHPDARSDGRRPPVARGGHQLGINVVGSSPGILDEYPWGVIPDKSIDRMEVAARQGGASVFVTGVDPGFVTDLLPLALASTCQSIEQIRTIEIADYATYDGATVMFDVMGFGNQIGDLPFLYQPGVLSAAWGVAIRQLAAGVGVEPEDILDSVEQEPAPEEIDVAVGAIKKGTVAAVRFEIEAIVDGRPAIVVEHIMRLHGDLRPTGPNRRRRAGPTGSRSPANPPTSWTSARPAATATTTTRRSWRRRGASSTPSGRRRGRTGDPDHARPAPGDR